MTIRRVSFFKKGTLFMTKNTTATEGCLFNGRFIDKIISEAMIWKQKKLFLN